MEVRIKLVGGGKLDTWKNFPRTALPVKDRKITVHKQAYRVKNVVLDRSEKKADVIVECCG